MRRVLELVARIADGAGRTITAIVRPFANALRLIVNLVLTLMEGIAQVWSVILTPFVRVFVELVRFVDWAVTTVFRFLRLITGAFIRVLAIVGELAQRLARIVEQVISALASAFRTIVDPLVRALRRALSSIVAVVRSVRAHLWQLVVFVGRPLVDPPRSTSGGARPHHPHVDHRIGAGHGPRDPSACPPPLRSQRSGCDRDRSNRLRHVDRWRAVPRCGDVAHDEGRVQGHRAHQG